MIVLNIGTFIITILVWFIIGIVLGYGFDGKRNIND